MYILMFFIFRLDDDKKLNLDSFRADCLCMLLISVYVHIIMLCIHVTLKTLLQVCTEKIQHKGHV